MLLSRILTVQEYIDILTNKIYPFADDWYKYLNFDQIIGFKD